jgi:fructose-specific phosphotransferase system IIC component
MTACATQQSLLLSTKNIIIIAKMEGARIIMPLGCAFSQLVAMSCFKPCEIETVNTQPVRGSGQRSSFSAQDLRALP